VAERRRLIVLKICIWKSRRDQSLSDIAMQLKHLTSGNVTSLIKAHVVCI
jgi:hypothetical protein